MYTVADVLRTKGRAVHTIDPEASALEAAQRMNERRIGSLLVVRAGRIMGIVSERDVMTRLVARERSPATTTVEQIMTPDVYVTSPHTLLADLREVMHARRIRHVPVLDQGEIAGLVSLGDLNVANIRVLTQTIGFLEGYIAG